MWWRTPVHWGVAVFSIFQSLQPLWTASGLCSLAATVQDWSLSGGAAEGAGEQRSAERQLLAGLNLEAKAAQERAAGSSGQGGEAQQIRAGSAAQDKSQSKSRATQQNPQVHWFCMRTRVVNGKICA